ncbi:hypothetical protein SAMN05444372_1207 [Flavobacterium micromati]|uniref:Lipoprotein n=1 Tax=Flavobacterium micromati TaxID=229205 RepID=A0A1M5QW61_9FLAO|nr:hypothetical protein [Flavobacterium micromati]MCL6462645.1 hypothetical protein [Flavobacterium micromati]SHH17949.1 hypothetical protein SAMN05444372_1207 [Flavobacterium micromati]
MENIKLVLGMVAIAIMFTACKDEREEQAQMKVDSYVVYVDSVSAISEVDAVENWEGIESSYQLRYEEAEVSMSDLKDSAQTQTKLDASKEKYEALKAKVEAQRIAAEAAKTTSNTKQQMRNSLFGDGKIGDDMNFAWVNAANIHNVYQQFVGTVDNNKDKYSREDWDEIKLLYEALDSRKNTVEKEGLSAQDNRKIAGLKAKFAPMYSVNRIGAKSSEMKEAKQ